MSVKQDTFYTIDLRRDLIIPGNKERTVQFATEHFITTAQNAIKEHGKFVVALSGGSTPKAIYHALANHRQTKEINWSKVHLFWSDEEDWIARDREYLKLKRTFPSQKHL